MGWIGVDLDGTLAEYHGWVGPEEIGAPIPLMVERVKDWLAKGQEVRIFTARCYPLNYVPVSYSPHWAPRDYEQIIAKNAVEAIRDWCALYLGQVLPITCVKDYKMWQLWDDRAVQVRQNTGVRMDGEPEGLPSP